MGTDATDDPDEKPKDRRLYRLCVTLGIVGGAAGLCVGVFCLARPLVIDSRDYLYTRDVTRQLNLGVQNCAEANGTLPGPHLDGSQADNVVPVDPADRLSWRVAVLPFVGQKWLYKKFNKTEAWNSPNNFPVSSTAVRAFTDQTDDYASTHTPFRVFHDNGALWDSDPKYRIALNAIPDGSENTVLFVESTEQVPWAQFNEHRYDPAGPLPPLGRASRNSFLAAMADGSVRVVKKTVSPDTLRAIITRGGNDAPGPDW